MEERRTFSGALARLFGLLLAIILFVLAIWFVVRQVNNVTSTEDTSDEAGTVVTVDDATNSVTERLIGEDTEIVVGESDSTIGAATEDEITAATDDTSGSSAVLASTTENLPNTGPTESLLGLFALVFATQMLLRFRKSRNQFETVRL